MATQRQIDFAYALAEQLGYDLSGTVRDMFPDRCSIEECSNKEAGEVIDYLLMERDSMWEAGW
ncbi:MAG: hypothetical protein HPY71_01500 [Firmicutes bacterium]|nr:hypothetical protein [Bacillota bacterium]